MIELTLTARTTAEMELLLALLLRGGVAAVRDDPELASSLGMAVFRTSFVHAAEQGASVALADAAHAATFLDDFADMVPRALKKALSDIDVAAQTAIQAALRTEARLVVGGPDAALPSRYLGPVEEP